MDLGNLLAPVIVFLVTMLLLTRLFRILETYQAKLQQSMVLSAALQEREKLARELHDGIAQSLFLIHVKVKRLSEQHPGQELRYQSILESIYQVNQYVRQAIASLRYSPQTTTISWKESLVQLIEQFIHENQVEVTQAWDLPEQRLSIHEQMALSTFVRESLLNVQKHAKAQRVRIRAFEKDQGWMCEISDDGRGFTGDPFTNEGSYGLRMLQERAQELGWMITFGRESGWTTLRFGKARGSDGATDSRVNH